MGLATLVAAVLVFGAAAQAQQRYQPSSVRPPFDQVEINTTDLGNRIYMLDGEGANITVAVSDDGVIMVDTEFAELNQKIKAAIAAFTDLPIRYLIITHFHRDHTGGNAGFAQDGAIIVAHENVMTVLEAGSLNGLTGNVVPPAPAGALPQLTYTDAAAIYLEDHGHEERPPERSTALWSVCWCAYTDLTARVSSTPVSSNASASSSNESSKTSWSISSLPSLLPDRSS